MELTPLVKAFVAGSTANVSTIRPLLAEDMTWDLNGERLTSTADDFVARQIEDQSTGSAEVEIDEIVVAGTEAVVIGWAVFTPSEGGGRQRARLAESLTIRDGAIIHVRDVMAFE